MVVHTLSDTELPSSGYIRRPHPVWLEFAKQMTWFSRIEIKPNGTPDMVYVWVLKKENREYERPHIRKRFCRTYRGESCQAYRERVIVAAKC